VKDSSPTFLQYLDKHKIALGSMIEVINKEQFDLSLTIRIIDKEFLISQKIANNLYVKIV
jgi:DtxR family Mn-dependent transcriptional regulator